MSIQVFPAESASFIENNTGLRIKFGIDPTRDRLHLGHFVPLRLCRRLLEKGHHLDLILGTQTAQLGDPSGQDQTRPILSEEECKENASQILRFVERALAPHQFRVHFNHEFIEGMSIPFFLTKLVSKFNVANMLSRDAFRNRMSANQPIALHELLVPLLQGWDSVQVKAQVEIGGTDQLFNFQVARELQVAHGQTPQVCMMTPIINGTDGRKMSKTFGNVIWMDETPENMVGQIMSIPDSVMEEWIPLLSDLTKFVGFTHPMERKKWLAFDIVSQLHSEEAARRGLAAFESLVQHREVPEDMLPSTSGPGLLEHVLMVRMESRSKARTLISQGGVSVNGVVVTDFDHVPVPGDVIRIGKREFRRVI